MLSRHFYPLDSVAESLYQTIGCHHDPLRRAKILFWTQELILSEEIGLLIQTFIRAWNTFCYPNVKAEEWLRNAEVNLQMAVVTPALADKVLEFIPYLYIPPLPEPYIPPTSSSSSSFSSSSSSSFSSSIPSSPKDWDTLQRRTLFVAVRDAIRHRQTERVYRLLAGLSIQDAFEYLRGYICEDSYKNSCKDVKTLKHLLEFVKGLTWTPPIEIQKKLPNFPIKKENIGLCSSRLFCLSKSLKNKKTFHPSGGDVLYGCAFWKRVLKESGCDFIQSIQTGTLTFHSDEQMEDFYMQYFPDDIPDEWSIKEKSKTHLHF